MISDSPNVLEERIHQPRRAAELALERHRDLLLDLFGGEAGYLRRDLRGHVADLRVCLDRQLGPGIIAEAPTAAPTKKSAPAQTDLEELVNH